MIPFSNTLDEAIEQLLESYGTRYPQSVRDVAETLIGARESGRLGTESDLAPILTEAISLYCDKHGIDAVQVADAVEFYVEMPERTNVMCEMTKALRDLQDTERMYRAMQPPEGRAANAWGSMPIG